jgi:Concanavalin A-like lectin/glucanases superfamily
MIKKTKNISIVITAVIIILMISFGIVVATGGLGGFGIKPNIVSGSGLVGAWSLAEKDLTEGANKISDASSSFVTDGTAFWIPAHGTFAWNSSTEDATFTASGTAGANIINGNAGLTSGNTYAISFRMKSSNQTPIPAIWNGSAYISVEGGSLSTNYQTFNLRLTLNYTRLVIRAGSSLDAGKDYTVDDIIIREIDVAIQDSSGNGNDGQIANTPATFIADQNGVSDQAMDFSGVSDYVNCGSDDVGKFGTNDFTISVWVNPDNSTLYDGILSYGTYNVANEWLLSVGVAGYLRFYYSNELMINLPGFGDGNWHHIVVKRNGNTGYFYDDGVQLDSFDLTGKDISASESLLIGAYGGGSSNLNGSVSDVAIYDKALTQSEVSQLYKSGRTSGGMKIDAREISNSFSTLFIDDSWAVSPGGSVTINSNINFDVDLEGGACYSPNFWYGRKGNKYKLYLDGTLTGVDLILRSSSGATYDGEVTLTITQAELPKAIEVDIITDTANLVFDSSGGTGNMSFTQFEIVDITNKYSVGSLQKGLILDMPLNENYTEAGSDVSRTFAINSGSPTINGDEITFADEGSSVVDGNYWEIGKIYYIDVEIQDYVGSGNINFPYDGSGASLVKSENGRWQYTYVPDDSTYVYIYSYVGHTCKVIVHSIKELDGTTKDRTPAGNDGTVSGASLEYDGLVNAGAGIAYIPSNTAYGTWEFDVYKSGSIYMPIISDGYLGDIQNDGYLLNIRSTGSIYFRKTGGSSTIFFTTAASYMTNDTDYRIKITRSSAGVFTVYIKGGEFGWDSWTLVDVSGGSGTNPVTDNTYTTSSYFVADLDNKDKVRNLEIDSKPIRLSNATQSTGTWTTTGPSYSFDGTDDYIDVPMTLASGSYSVSFWGYKDADCVTDRYVMDLRTGGGVGYMIFDGTSGNNNLQVINGTVYTNGLATNPEIPEAVWQHYVITGTSLQSISNIMIGKYNASSSYNFDGQISGLKIWNRVLSTDEIDSLYNKEKREF